MRLASIFDRYAHELPGTGITALATPGARRPDSDPGATGQDANNPDIAAMAERQMGHARLSTRTLAYAAFNADIAVAHHLSPAADRREEDEEDRRRERMSRFIRANNYVISQMQSDAILFLEENIKELDDSIAAVQGRLDMLDKLQRVLEARLAPLYGQRERVNADLHSHMERINCDGRLCHAVGHADAHGPRTPAQEAMQDMVGTSLRAPSADGTGPLIVACRASTGEIVDYYLIGKDNVTLLSEMPDAQRGAIESVIETHSAGAQGDRRIHDLPDVIRTAMAAEGHGTVTRPHSEVAFLIDNIQGSFDERHRIEQEIEGLREDFERNREEIAALNTELADLNARRAEAVTLLRDIKEKNLDGAELQKAMEASSFGASWNNFLEATGAKPIVDMLMNNLPAPLASTVQSATATLSGLFTNNAAAPESGPSSTGENGIGNDAAGPATAVPADHEAEDNAPARRTGPQLALAGGP